MFSDYFMFLFRNKRCYSGNFQLFWSPYSYIFWFLEIKIWPICWLYQQVSTLWLSLAENQIHLSRQWKCCYAYTLKFLCVQRFISLFLIAFWTRFHYRFLVLLFYLRFDQIGNKLQQPLRNQRHKFTRYTKCQHYVQQFWSCPYGLSMFAEFEKLPYSYIISISPRFHKPSHLLLWNSLNK